MKHTLQQVFRSGKFVFGFFIFVTILLVVIVYPLIIPDAPLTIIGRAHSSRRESTSAPMTLSMLKRNIPSIWIPPLPTGLPAA